VRFGRLQPVEVTASFRQHVVDCRSHRTSNPE
jgi:hypothetical protein